MLLAGFGCPAAELGDCPLALALVVCPVVPVGEGCPLLVGLTVLAGCIVALAVAGCLAVPDWVGCPLVVGVTVTLALAECVAASLYGGGGLRLPRTASRYGDCGGDFSVFGVGGLSGISSSELLVEWNESSSWDETSSSCC